MKGYYECPICGVDLLFSIAPLDSTRYCPHCGERVTLPEKFHLKIYNDEEGL